MAKYLFAGLLLAVTATTVLAEGPDPKTYLREIYAQTSAFEEPATGTSDSNRSNSGPKQYFVLEHRPHLKDFYSKLATEISKYVDEEGESERLAAVADLDQWRGIGRFQPRAIDLGEEPGGASGRSVPFSWNPTIAKFQLSRRDAYQASHVALRFTWHFLLAYSSLNEDLRKTGGPLAIGVAAYVAGEVDYPDRWSHIPIELQSHAATVQVLLLYRRDLLNTCRTRSMTEIKATVNDAVQQMFGPRHAEMIESHKNLDWVYESDGAHQPLSEILPVTQVPLQGLLGRVKGKNTAHGGSPGIQNLALEALIVADICQRWLGPVQQHADPKACRRQWLAEFERLGRLIESEKRIRNIKGRIAVSHEQERLNSLTAMDATSVIPLAAMAQQIDWPRWNVIQNKQDLEHALDSPEFRRLIQLYGRPADRFGPEDFKLEWGTLCRTPESKGEIIVMRFASPSGPTRPEGDGIGANVWVGKRGDDGKRELVRAEDLKAGDQVQGFVTLPPSSVRSWFKPDEVEPKWFIVLNTDHRESDTCIKLILRGEGEGNSELTVARRHSILTQVDAAAVWTQANHIDRTDDLWSGSESAEIRARAINDHRKNKLVRLSLALPTARGRACNMVVYPTSQGRIPVLVAAHSLDAGPIHVDTLLSLGDGKSVRAGDLVAGDLSQTEVNAYTLEQGSLARFSTQPLSKVAMTPQVSYRLNFDSAPDVTVGEGNWFLLSDGSEIIQRHVAALEPNDEIVAGMVGEKLKTVRLVSKKRSDDPSSDFVQLHLANLPWIAGPVVLSVGHYARDANAVGLTTAAKLSLPSGQGSDLRASLQSLPCEKLSRQQPILAFDSVIKKIVQVTVDQEDLTSTRTVELVLNDGTGLVAGPAQRIHARTESGEKKLIRADQLTTRDQVLRLSGGKNQPELQKIVGVRANFHRQQTLHALDVSKVVAMSAQDRSDLVDPGLIFVNGVAVEPASKTIKAASTSVGSSLAHLIPSQRPRLIDLHPKEQVQLPGLLFQRRGEKMLMQFEQECESNQIGQSSGPVLATFLQDSVGPYPIQQWLDVQSNPKRGLDWFLKHMLHHRAEFLDDPHESALPALLSEQLLLAALLMEYNAVETADIVVLDFTEIVLFAGCDRQAKMSRRLSEDLGLANLLYVPLLLRENDDDVAEVSADATKAVKAWVDRERKQNKEYTEITDEESFWVKGLYQYWRNKMNLDPQWRRIPTSTKLWGGSNQAKELLSWLRGVSPQIAWD